MEPVNLQLKGDKNILSIRRNWKNNDLGKTKTLII